jgi:hypothetical protein
LIAWIASAWPRFPFPKQTKNKGALAYQSTKVQTGKALEIVYGVCSFVRLVTLHGESPSVASPALGRKGSVLDLFNLAGLDLDRVARGLRLGVLRVFLVFTAADLNEPDMADAARVCAPGGVVFSSTGED